MTSFSDNFNRADSTDLGAGWVEVSGDWSIVSNQLSPGALGGTIILRAATAMATDNNFAQATIAATTAASQGVWCRGNSNISQGYLWRNNGTSWDLFSVVGGSFSVIGTYAVAAAPGDIAKVQAVGSTITAYVNGVVRVTVTDTAVTTGTSVGIRSDSVSGVRYDDFSAGDVVTSSTGTGSGNFGSLTATASGTPTVTGTGSSQFGTLTGTATGTPKVSGTAALSGGTLTTQSSGLPTVNATGVAQLGSLVAHGGSPSFVSGSGTAEFSALTAVAAQGSTQAPPTQGSWWQLVSIKSEAVAWKLYEKTTPPLACPYDGEPLRSMPGGGVGLYCPLGDYEWPRQPRYI